MRIALIFDNLIRPDTTGGYCLRALQGLAEVQHFLPDDLDRVPRSGFDLYLVIDDGLRWFWPADFHPCAWWAIDTHLDPDWYRTRGRSFDFLFAAQKDGAAALRDDGLPAFWLPLACDPDIHRRYTVPKCHDVCFVGHLAPGPRADLVACFQKRFPSCFVGQRYFEDMARAYSESRLVFNRSIRNDVNMRVFEAAACGSLLVTNDLSDKGQQELLRAGEHLIVYSEAEEMLDKMAYYLCHEEEREAIAAAGRAAVLQQHTYRHRMERLLATVERGLDGRAIMSAPLPGVEAAEETNPPSPAPHVTPAAPAPPNLTSIIILTYNQLHFTRLCVESIRRHTDVPYELIFVDNGSTDGTVDYLKSQAGVTLLTNPTNVGFPKGVNQGLRIARGEQLLLLNNDTVVTPGWLRRLLAPLDDDCRIGLVGPCSNNISGVQQVPVTYQDLSGLDDFAVKWAEEHQGERMDVNRLTGFCLLLRRELLQRIGYLDERFGLGNFEDDDYSRRALLAGYRDIIARDVFIHHFGSQTFRGNGVDLGGLLQHNRRQFEAKWAPGSDAWRAVAQLRTGDESGIRLSLCMIVRDNQDILGPCLTSIRPWVDEMIVVDTGSRDQTPNLAERLGARVFYFPWCDDFAAARNESLRHARGRWLFWMDSDDIIDEANGRKLRDLACQDADPSLLGYVMQVHCPAAGEDGVLHTTVVDHVKMLRNLPAIRFEGRIHEQVLASIRRLDGEVGWTDIYVVHAGYDHSPEGQRRKRERDLRLLHLEHQERGDHPFTLFNLGMTYTHLGCWREATDYLRRSIARATPGESHLRKAYALLATCYQQMGAGELAWATCQEGLRRIPGDPELCFRTALLLHEGGQTEEAARMYEQLLAAPMERHFSSMDQGILGYKARQNLAIVYQEMGRLSQAEEQWRRVVGDKPAYRLGWRGLVEVLVQNGQLAEAEQVIEQIPEQGSLAVEKLLLRGRSLLARGAYDEARRAFERAVNQAPEDLPARQSWSHFLFEHGRPEESESALQELLRREPGDPAVHHNLGTIYLRLGQGDRAVKAYRESLRLRPHSPATRLLLEQALQQSRLEATQPSCA
ncbi:MAG TPA: glycosyltransferase [Gemmataceae bacterium]|nr:glycosyltransferase [Gemmataceae bacterium]